MATAFERQPIAVIANAAAPEVDTDEVAKLLSLFDHALDHHRAIAAMCASVPGAQRDTCSALLTVNGSKNEYAEYAAQLWCSAAQFTWLEHTHEYRAGEIHACAASIRAIRIKVDGVDVINIYFAPVVHAEVTATAIREALRKPHWTDDKTLTDEERAERERMEAGHA